MKEYASYEIFDRLLAQKKIKAADVHRATGIPNSVFSDWKNGRSNQPSAKYMPLIANYFEKPIEYFHYDDEELAQYVEQERLREEQERLSATSISEDVNIDQIPVLQETDEGNPVIQFDETISYVQLPDAPEPDFCVVVNDESMELFGIHNGDLVFCETTKNVDNGDIAAVILDQNTILRRVYQSPANEDTIILSAGTPEYPPVFLKGEEKKKARIVGRAVSVMSSVRLFK